MWCDKMKRLDGKIEIFVHDMPSAVFTMHCDSVISKNFLKFIVHSRHIMTEFLLFFYIGCLYDCISTFM